MARRLPDGTICFDDGRVIRPTIVAMGNLEAVMEEAWRESVLKSLDTRNAWEVMEDLRLHRITVSVGSIEPFDPKVRYCEPFDHDQRYKAQVWDKDTQMYQKASYGKTPEEAFRKAVREVLEKKK